jgi:SAM-dependent methyltransferase
MASLKGLQDNWETLAQIDPLWSICADPHKRNNHWDEKDFFATGRTEIAKVLQHVEGLGLHLEPSAPVLDFGCGVGRLTRALADHFDECWGVDISPTMVQKARELNRDRPHCKFWLNETDNLKNFADGYFGFIYTSIVLQHIEAKYAINYIADLLRVLKPGGVFVFQLVHRFKVGILLKLRIKLALRSRLERLVAGKGSRPQGQIVMHCLPERNLLQLLASKNVRVHDVQWTNSAESAFNGNLQYLGHEPERGFVSKQYCVVKNT